jgi:uncharacterized membrane protein YhdT
MRAMLQEFYAALAQVSFTVLGLWLVVIQLRRDGWRSSRSRRVGARAVAIDFALPGVMSLLALADPDGAVLWRVAFTVFGALGALGLALLIGDPGTSVRGGRLARWSQWLVLILYVAVALVAMLAAPIAGGLQVAPLQVEAVLLSVLLLVGLAVAVGQLLEADEDEAAQDAQQ